METNANGNDKSPGLFQLWLGCLRKYRLDWDPFPEEIENILFEEERAYGEDSGSENEEDEFEYGSDVETDEELSEE